ncbi:hypothetical protein IFM89_039036 [Coptis chinensis]|uniref:Uncharacterized protein n=1 Tax=Coptis chinensis TaxID=261450 RepID=A0A835IIS1_9MAGN|nr:hypothetical protein IFM89_039036 [Coptis chinensis]
MATSNSLRTADETLQKMQPWVGYQQQKTGLLKGWGVCDRLIFYVQLLVGHIESGVQLMLGNKHQGSIMVLGKKDRTKEMLLESVDTSKRDEPVQNLS